ncbi:MAG TPA: hypothetical protein VE090_02535 [Methylomirabilota bacterium]|nr:hypothetical protein [Methylomirabilota bacterium]
MNEQSIKDFILPKVKKFIEKVETGKARSVETYEDMKRIRDFLDSLPMSKKYDVDGVVFTREADRLIIEFKVDNEIKRLRIGWQNAHKMAEIMQILFLQSN